MYVFSRETAFVQESGPDWDGDPIGYVYGRYSGLTQSPTQPPQAMSAKGLMSPPSGRRTAGSAWL